MNEPRNSNPPSQLEETTEALWGLPDEDDHDDEDEVEEEKEAAEEEKKAD
jgi:hypothetical protein